MGIRWYYMIYYIRDKLEYIGRRAYLDDFEYQWLYPEHLVVKWYDIFLLLIPIIGILYFNEIISNRYKRMIKAQGEDRYDMFLEYLRSDGGEYCRITSCFDRTTSNSIYCKSHLRIKDYERN